MHRVILRNVSKSFGAVRAVDDLSLELREGEILSLLGPSGCGKTTTLRLIAGFEMPDSGSIIIGGRTVAEAGRGFPPEARGVGMVFQDYALFPHLTVAQNVGFGLSRLPRKERARRITALLEAVGLRDLAGRYPNELSGGQQQRVALARALAPRPAVILMDEPFSNLDAALKAQMRQEVFALLKAEGMSAILVTHDQKDAFAVSDRVAVMNQGRIEQIGTPREIYQRPATRFVASFVGATNLVSGRFLLQPPCIETPWGCIPCREVAGLALGADVTVSIRPDSLRVDPEGPFSGQVIAAVYGGNSIEVTVEVPCGQRLLIHAHPQENLRPGQTVRFKALPDFISVVETHTSRAGA